MSPRNLLRTALLASILNIDGCTTSLVTQSGSTESESMEMSSSADTYTVQTGDTLYTIAKRFGKNVQDLAQLNHLEPPYHIYPHQILKINNPCPHCKQVYRGNRSLPSPSSPDQECSPPLPWQWPTQPLKITSQPGQKGINLFGRKGQTVYAAASGTVTDSENSTNGYHSLIIQHNDAFSSVYGHLRDPQVKTRYRITSGQPIAKMETGTSSQPSSFYFEIRCWGKPLNPLDYLPTKR